MLSYKPVLQIATTQMFEHKKKKTNPIYLDFHGKLDAVKLHEFIQIKQNNYFHIKYFYGSVKILDIICQTVIYTFLILSLAWFFLSPHFVVD